MSRSGRRRADSLELDRVVRDALEIRSPSMLRDTIGHIDISIFTRDNSIETVVTHQIDPMTVGRKINEDDNAQLADPIEEDLQVILYYIITTK